MSTLITFSVFLGLFALVGVASVVRREDTTDDYLLAGQSVSPLLVAASSFATNFSGYMFIGVVGFVYLYGVSALWLTVGWTLGEFIVWGWGHGAVRRYVQAHPALTVSAMVATEPTSAGARTQRGVVGLTALATLVLLSLYASAQMTAGSKALHVLFDWPLSTGVLLGAGIVLVYCWAGGLRATIWSDLAQAIVMLVAMLMLLYQAVRHVGGPIALLEQLHALDPALTSVAPRGVSYGLLGVALYAVGWVTGGLGNLGQPHLLIRTMALRAPEQFPRTRAYYLTGTTLFRLLVMVVALYARAMSPANVDLDAELTLPRLAMDLLHPVAAGMFLAGLFAASMSTADSLLLTCSAALTRDLPTALRARGRPVGYVGTKLGTVGLTLFALVMALYGPRNVFEVVNFSWAAMASMLAPLLVLRLARRPVPQPTAVAMLLSGLAVSVTWRLAGLHAIIFETAPGMLAGLATYAVIGALGRR